MFWTNVIIYQRYTYQVLPEVPEELHDKLVKRLSTISGIDYVYSHGTFGLFARFTLLTAISIRRSYTLGVINESFRVNAVRSEVTEWC